MTGTRTRKRVADDNSLLKTASRLVDKNHSCVTLNNGETIKIKALTVGTFPKVLTILTDILGMIGLDNFDALENIDKSDFMKDPIKMMKMMADLASSPAMMEIINLLTDLEKDKWQDLEIEDSMKILTSLWKRNESFLLMIAGMQPKLMTD